MEEGVGAAGILATDFFGSVFSIFGGVGLAGSFGVGTAVTGWPPSIFSFFFEIATSVLVSAFGVSVFLRLFAAVALGDDSRSVNPPRRVALPGRHGPTRFPSTKLACAVFPFECALTGP